LAQAKDSSKTKENKNKPVPAARKAAAAKTRAVPTPVRASCKAKAAPKSPEPSPLKSPNPQPLKRLKGKQPPNESKIIEELQEAYQLVYFHQFYIVLHVCADSSVYPNLFTYFATCALEANRKMALELQQLKENTKRVDNFKTPPPKVSAPSPEKGSPTPVSQTAQGSKGDPKAKKVIMPPGDRPPPATEGAKLNRLRRLCEVKPSGKCQVPASVHERWKHGSKEDKEAMIEELEKVNWSKDPFLNHSY